MDGIEYFIKALIRVAMDRLNGRSTVPMLSCFPTINQSMEAFNHAIITILSSCCSWDMRIKRATIQPLTSM